MLSRRLPSVTTAFCSASKFSKFAAASAPVCFSATRWCSSSNNKPPQQPDAAATAVQMLSKLEERMELLERVVTNLVADQEAVVPGQPQQQQQGEASEKGTTIAVTDQHLSNTHHRTVVPSAALRAVCKVYASVIAPNTLQPWQVKPLTSATGTAFVIDRKRRLLLTNCHVVAYSSLIELRRHGEARRFPAECRFISGDCDLALLEVKDDDFWADETVQPPPFFAHANGANATPAAESAVATTLEEIATIGAFHGFPSLQDTVNVCGMPLGGDGLSITSGVISRIEQVPYSTSGLRLASLQVDAPINPGNSGGPALCNGKVVGVAFQSLLKSEGIGYLISNAVVAHFVRAFLQYEKTTTIAAESNNDGAAKQQQQQEEIVPQTGFHEGFPLLGIYFQELASPVLRRHFQIPDGDRYNGFLVEKLTGGSPNAEVLKPGDIIMRVDGRQIERDITIEWRPGERMPFTHLVHMCNKGDVMKFDVWRDGKEETIDLTTDIPPSLVRSHLLHPRFGATKQPPFALYSGCVFTVLSVPYLEAWGANWGTNAPRTLINHFMYGEVSEEQTEIVVLSQILPHPSNRGYSSDTLAHRAVAKVNGHSVKSFEHFVELVRAAVRDESTEFVNFSLTEGNYPCTVVLSRKEAKDADAFLCKTHGIPEEKAMQCHHSASA